MRPKELRIGNLIFVDGEETTVKGWMIHLLQIGKTNCKKIEPIPITEEWLERLGFRKDKKNVYLSPYETAMNDDCFTRMCFDFLEDKMFIINSNAYDGFHVECIYAHQLQNLYFALTGEELTIKS